MLKRLLRFNVISKIFSAFSKLPGIWKIGILGIFIVILINLLEGSPVGVRLYVLKGDGDLRCEVNGKPVEHLNQEGRVPPFQKAYAIPSSKGSHQVKIYRNDEVLFSMVVNSGSYVVNLSSEHLVAATSVVYSKIGTRSYEYGILSPVGVGIYDIETPESNDLVFGFFDPPKKSISRKGSSLVDVYAVKLHALRN